MPTEKARRQIEVWIARRLAKPGTGLGLFIARSIAEAHGGSLDVDSIPERGSVFRLELPAG